MPPSKMGEISMSLRDYPNNYPFKNQDVIPYLTTVELRELSNLKELKRSTTAALIYFEEREGAIFSTARTRITDAGGAEQ